MERLQARRWKAALATLLAILLAGYLAAFTIVNFWGFTDFITADMYSDTLVARYMWEQKTLFPDGWTFGNQYYVIATPVLAALFYGVSGSMNTAMALATTAMTLLLLTTMCWMLRPFLSRVQVLTALAAITACILAIDLRDKIEAQILFVLASYYACYLITLFVVWGDYVRGLLLKKRFLCVSFPLSLLLSFCTGMQSIRQTVIMVLPLLAFEALRLLRDWVRTRRFPVGAVWLPTLRAGAAAAANIAGLFCMRLLHIPSTTIYGSASLIAPEGFAENLSTAVRAMGSVTGIRYASLYEPAWFIVLFSVLSILAVLSAMFKTLRTPPKQWGGLEVLLLLCALSVSLLLAGSLVMDISLRSIYLFVWYPLVALSVVCLIRCTSPRRRAAIFSIFSLLAAGNLYVSYAPAVETVFTDAPPTVEAEMADWLTENGYGLVYGNWWSASVTAAETDGAVLAGAWHDGVFHILPYINALDIYTDTDNGHAAYIITAGEYDAAASFAAARGITLTQLAVFDGGTVGLYAASGQLMYFK